MIECMFTGCTRPVSAKGLCAPHYQQMRAGKPLRPLADRTSFQYEKFCPRCEQVKPRDAFYVRKNDRLQSECKECMIERSRERQEKLRAALAYVEANKASENLANQA